MEDIRRTACREECATIDLGRQRLEGFVVDEGAHVKSLVARELSASGSVECSDDYSLTSPGHEQVTSA